MYIFICWYIYIYVYIYKFIYLCIQLVTPTAKKYNTLGNRCETRPKINVSKPLLSKNSSIIFQHTPSKHRPVNLQPTVHVSKFLNFWALGMAWGAVCWGMIGLLLLFNLYLPPPVSTAVSFGFPALLPSRLEPRHVMWDSDVDFDLAAFHSLVRALKRILVEEANPHSTRTNHFRESFTWWFKVTFLGWLSDLQWGDKKRSRLESLGMCFFFRLALILYVGSFDEVGRWQDLMNRMLLYIWWTKSRW